MTTALSLELPRRNWYPANHRALCAFLARHTGPEERTAVFDWDNTCVFQDIGEATFRYQLENLALRLTPTQLHAMLPHRIGDVTCLEGSLRLADISGDILTAYVALWPRMQAERTGEVQRTAAHQDFRAKMGRLYQALEDTPQVGAAYAYPWLLRLFDGFTPSEVQAMAWCAWQAAALEPIGTAQWHSVSPGACGMQTFGFATHIAVYPEMADLVAALSDSGFKVFVVTASFESVVRGVAARLGFAVAPQHILGMRPSVPGQQYPLTYRAGKVQVINRYVPTPPLLVAGDTNTDYEMLTHFKQTEIRLLIHRNIAAGDIRKLYHAAAHPDLAGPQTLLQARDARQGGFVPQRDSLA